MPVETVKKTVIGVTAFKSKCLGLIDDVANGKMDSIVLLKHNRPIAKIVPIKEKKGRKHFELWGAMKGTFTIAPGVDLTESTGEVWDAEQ
jgi:antitoxin (DNA-binding transcriptional repressor) of toxin-antitoxin stability system